MRVSSDAGYQGTPYQGDRAFKRNGQILSLSPREVFVEALRSEAVHIILIHNHPSGDPAPSKEDMSVTKSIYEMGMKLDIPLIDHIIIGDNKYISFKEQGYL